MNGSSTSTYLVTGSMGCIGAWTLRHLVEAGERVISFDLSDDRRRLDLLLARERQDEIAFVQGQITDFDKLLETLQQHQVDRIIHLAALQIPFCKADPVTGANVNVVGTVNVLEAARQAGLRHVSFASSIAVYGRADPTADAPPANAADTLYGVYKQANEGTARVYWQDHGVSSIALRPYTVYGVGRDQGLTSEPTKAMLAAAAGRPYRIGFGGRMQFHYASDVALQFIEAASTQVEGALAFNLGSAATAVADVVEVIRRLRPGSAISHVEQPLPFAEAYDPGDLERFLPATRETPLEEGVRETLEHFERLLSQGRINA